jgi:uncharacterized protein
MKKLLLLLVLFTVLGSAHAQSTSYKSTLKTLLEAAGTEATFKVAIKQMFDMFKQQKTNVPESVWADFEKEFSQTSMDDLVEMMVPIYQRHMTEDELKNIIKFYETPAGKKYAEKTPLIMQESMQAGQEWGMKVGQRFQEKLKEKGY